MRAFIAIFALVAVASASPATSDWKRKDKTASTKAAPVFKEVTYNEIDITKGGKAGNAEADAKKIFKALPTDLTTVAEADINFLRHVTDICSDAENGVYIPKMISAEVGEPVIKLRRALIMNKVLKNMAKVLMVQVLIAQGNKSLDDALKESQKKLGNNIAQDKIEANKAATSLPFTASTADPAASEQKKLTDAELKKFNEKVSASFKKTKEQDPSHLVKPPPQQ